MYKFLAVHRSPVDVHLKSMDPGVKKYNILPIFRGYIYLVLTFKAALREVQLRYKKPGNPVYRILLK